jgi:hypothetical protein
LDKRYVITHPEPSRDTGKHLADKVQQPWHDVLSDVGWHAR